MDRIAHALELVGALTTSKTVNSAVHLFEKAIEPFGVRIYSAAAMGNWVRDPVPVVGVTNWPDEWKSFYDGTQALSFDPVVSALRRSDGFFWRDLAESPLATGRKLMRDAREIGMIDGFTAVNHVPGQLPSAVSLSGDTLDWNELDRGVVRFLGSSLMSRMLYLRDVALTPAVKALSPREAHILSHAALGHDDHRIAAELDVAYNTVRAHWRAIRLKLGAADRAQAVAIGLWSGQILP